MRIREVVPIELAAPGDELSSPWSSTVVFVRVTTDSGLVGWGEAPTTLSTRPVWESVREVARFYEGKEVDESAQAFEEFRRYSFYLSRSFEATAALSAVDIACWDLRGREVGAPVSELLGARRRDRVRTYANGWYSDCQAPEEFAERARAMVREGFSALKFDPFGDGWDHLTPGQLSAASGRVSATREAVGPGVDLLIECHGRFNPESAIRAGRALDQFLPLFIEEPTHPEECDALAEFRRQVKTRVALGERLLNAADFESFLRRGLVDVLQPDLTNSGGFSGGLAIAKMAAAHGAPVAYHNAFGPIQTAATLQMDAVLSTFLIQESFESSWPAWKRNLVRGYSLERGEFQIPKGPGLGIEVDERRVEEARSDKMEPIGPEPPWVIAHTWTSPAKGPSRDPTHKRAKPGRPSTRPGD